LAAALRECEEEIGLAPQAVEALGTLDDTETVATQFVITPFVGLIGDPPAWRPDGEEIEKVIEVPLAALLEDGSFRVETWERAGGRAFCAGADLKGAGDGGTTLQARESFGGLARILEAMARMRTPVIAQVHGFALAGGCGLAVGCDIVIASEDATFGLPEITLGLLPLIVMAPVLRAAGTKRGLPFVLSAENISAREALDIGLVSRVVPRAA